jgi:hypothetical protein
MGLEDFLPVRPLLIVLMPLTAAAFLLVQKVPVTSTGIDQHGLLLVSATAADSAKWIDKTLGRTRVPELEAMLPYSVILKNTSKKRVVFYAMRWSTTSKEGQVVHDDRMFYNLGTLRGGYAVDPGAAWLVSAVDAVNRPVKAGDDFVTQFHRTRMDLQFLQQSQLAISLDVAIFADGEVVGPDASHSLEHAKARLDAARDLNDAFKGHTGRREPAALYISGLKQLLSEPGKDLSGGQTRWYRHHQKQLAGELIRAFQEGGETALEDRLRQSFRANLQLHHPQDPTPAKVAKSQ